MVKHMQINEIRKEYSLVKFDKDDISPGMLPVIPAFGKYLQTNK